MMIHSLVVQTVTQTDARLEFDITANDLRALPYQTNRSQVQDHQPMKLYNVYMLSKPWLAGKL